MRRRRHSWVWACLLGWSLWKAHALGQPMQALDATHEPRLNQPISLREPSIPLQSLMRRLSQETGLDLRVIDSVRDFRVCLLVHEQPLHEVLQRLADTFGFRWTRQKDKEGREYYLLLEPREARAERERLSQFLTALREREPADILREATRRIPDFVFRLSYAEYSKAIGQKEDGAITFREADERLKPLLLTTPSPLPSTPQAIYDRYLTRLARQILLSYPTLYLLGNLREEEWEKLRQYGWLSLTPERVPEDLAESIRNLPVQIYDLLNQSFNFTVNRLQLICTDSEFELQVVWDQRKEGETRSSGTIRYELAHLSLSSVQQILSEALEAVLLKSVELPPTLDCRLPTALEKEAWDAWYHLPAWLLVGAAESCQLNLIGEWSPVWLGLTAQGYLEIRWDSLLRNLARGYWLTRDGQWLMIQVRLPALARVLELPDAEFRQWFRRGEMDIDTAATLERRLFIAHFDALSWLRVAYLSAKRTIQMEPPLRLGQQLSYIQGVPFVDPLYDALNDLRGGSSVIRQLLRFYGRLNTMQRATLKRGGTLRWEQLTQSQQVALLRVLMNWELLKATPSLQVRLQPAELPQSVMVLGPSTEGVPFSAWYSFPEEVAREAGIPFVKGCKFVVDGLEGSFGYPLVLPLKFALR